MGVADPDARIDRLAEDVRAGLGWPRFGLH
jgi:hypothetical protein